MDDQYSEAVGDIKEVKVDGLPALTRLKTYQQNETIKERVWLIWNGKSVIQFSVKAVLNNYDDNEAWKVIEKVKVKVREGEPSFPEPKKQYAEKPDHFPQKTVELFADYWGNEPVLSETAIQNALAFYKLLSQIKSDTNYVANKSDKDKKEFLDSLCVTCNLNDWNHFELIVKASGAAADPILKLLVDLETIDKNSENYKLTSDAVVQIAKQTHLSMSDLQFVYNNWDSVNEFLLVLKP